MMHRRPAVLPSILVLALALWAGAAVGQRGGARDPDVAPTAAPTQASRLPSGPQAGAAVRPIPAIAVVGGDRAGAEIDAAAGLAEGPGVVLFVHELTREVAPLIRTVDRLGVAYATRGLETVIVRVADDRTEAETRMPMVSQSLRLRRPIVVSVDGGDGPGDYALNRKAALTVVLTLDGKVAQAFGLTDTGRKDVGMLEAAVAEVAGAMPDPDGEPLPTDVATLQALVKVMQRDNAMLRDELEALRERMQQNRGRMRGEPGGRNPGAPGVGGERDAVPLPDRSIGAQIRILSRKDATDEQVRAALQALTERVAESDDQKAQARSMVQRLLEREFSTESGRKLIRAWLDGQGR